MIGVDNKGNPSKHQLRFEGLRDYENKISTATEPSVAVDAEKVEFRISVGTVHCRLYPVGVLPTRG